MLVFSSYPSSTIIFVFISWRWEGSKLPLKRTVFCKVHNAYTLLTVSEIFDEVWFLSGRSVPDGIFMVLYNKYSVMNNTVNEIFWACLVSLHGRSRSHGNDQTVQWRIWFQIIFRIANAVSDEEKRPCWAVWSAKKIHVSNMVTQNTRLQIMR